MWILLAKPRQLNLGNHPKTPKNVDWDDTQIGTTNPWSSYHEDWYRKEIARKEKEGLPLSDMERIIKERL